MQRHLRHFRNEIDLDFAKKNPVSVNNYDFAPFLFTLSFMFIAVEFHSRQKFYNALVDFYLLHLLSGPFRSTEGGQSRYSPALEIIKNNKQDKT